MFHVLWHTTSGIRQPSQHSDMQTWNDRQACMLPGYLPAPMARACTRAEPATMQFDWTSYLISAFKEATAYVWKGFASR